MKLLDNFSRTSVQLSLYEHSDYCSFPQRLDDVAGRVPEYEHVYTRTGAPHAAPYDLVRSRRELEIAVACLPSNCIVRKNAAHLLGLIGEPADAGAIRALHKAKDHRNGQRDAQRAAEVALAKLQPREREIVELQAEESPGSRAPDPSRGGSAVSQRAPSAGRWHSGTSVNRAAASSRNKPCRNVPRVGTELGRVGYGVPSAQVAPPASVGGWPIESRNMAIHRMLHIYHCMAIHRSLAINNSTASLHCRTIQHMHLIRGRPVLSSSF